MRRPLSRLPRDGTADHAPDQIFVANAEEPPEDDEIAVDGVNAGQRVHLDETGYSLTIATDVDAGHVAKAERAPDIDGNLLDIGGVRELVLDLVQVIALDVE